MKKWILGTILLFTFNAYASAQEITFETESINYGQLEQGANGVREFHFKNTGNAPLVISDAKKSCGCTVPHWPKEPILPGQTSTIKVKYDTKRVGTFTKYITVTSNAKNNSTVRLKIQGKIEAEKKATPSRNKNLFNP